MKCTLSDDRTVPEHLDSLINTFLTPQGAGTGNISDYYSDNSYGAISFAGTQVYGCNNCPTTANSDQTFDLNYADGGSVVFDPTNAGSNEGNSARVLRNP